MTDPVGTIRIGPADSSPTAYRIWLKQEAEVNEWRCVLASDPTEQVYVGARLSAGELERQAHPVVGFLPHSPAAEAAQVSYHHDPTVITQAASVLASGLSLDPAADALMLHNAGLLRANEGAERAS